MNGAPNGLQYIDIKLPAAVAAFREVSKEELTTYLNARTALRWAFLSAADPGGVTLDDDENVARTRAVVLYVTRLGYQAVWHGDSECPPWLPTGGVLIIGIPRPAAEHLGIAVTGNQYFLFFLFSGCNTHRSPNNSRARLRFASSEGFEKTRLPLDSSLFLSAFALRTPDGIS